MVNGNCLTEAKRKEFRELTIKPKARPSKSEGLGEFFGRSRGENISLVGLGKAQGLSLAKRTLLARVQIYT